MNNPFKKNGEMLPIASINSVYVDDVKAYDLFRPSLILSDVIEQQGNLGQFDPTQHDSLSSIFQHLLLHDLDSIKRTATDIAMKYGYRLAKVLSTLLKPSLKSISNRTDWTTEHWGFWKSIRQIYLVGGVTSPLLTRIFYDCIQDEFHNQNIHDVIVSFVDGSQHLGTRGMSSLIEDGEYLLFDFGQTSIKRAHHIKQSNKIILDTTLPSVPSDFLFYKSSTIQEIKQTAVDLDNYIVDVIFDTAEETCFKGNNLFISVANYVSDGRIYSARGGYGKLAYIADNYLSHLKQRVTDKLGRTVHIKLFHDTSAMALLFAEDDHTAVISLGTAFGVAFPDKT